LWQGGGSGPVSAERICRKLRSGYFPANFAPQSSAQRPRERRSRQRSDAVELWPFSLCGNNTAELVSAEPVPVHRNSGRLFRPHDGSHLWLLLVIERLPIAVEIADEPGDEAKWPCPGIAFSREVIDASTKIHQGPIEPRELVDRPLRKR
jgi:hypothetical protein